MWADVRLRLAAVPLAGQQRRVRPACTLLNRQHAAPMAADDQCRCHRRRRRRRRPPHLPPASRRPPTPCSVPLPPWPPPTPIRLRRAWQTYPTLCSLPCWSGCCWRRPAPASRLQRRWPAPAARCTLPWRPLSRCGGRNAAAWASGARAWQGRTACRSRPAERCTPLLGRARATPAAPLHPAWHGRPPQRTPSPAPGPTSAAAWSCARGCGASCASWPRSSTPPAPPPFGRRSHWRRCWRPRQRCRCAWV